ncbi:MAG TPA: endolytic transglycosylase MltG [Allosphingosinicella sp.]|nr:endolytic transglycosylase MltG [Allosphingosinicella sp.]
MPKPPRRKRSRKTLFIAGAIAAAVALALILFIGPWLPRGRTEGAEPVDIVIEQGDSLSRAAEKLEQAGIISSAGHFKLLARLVGGGSGIKVGEYAFFPSDGWSQHLATLQSGRSIQRLVVIPEGMPSVVVHERLMKTDLLTGDIPVPEEGSLLPSSYDYHRGEARSAVVARMQEGMRRELARLWAQRSPNSVVKSPEEAIILASIVEKETSKPEERRRVAGVYTNRLRQGIKLDADPTVIYPVTRGRPLGRRILRSELQAAHGYNTYARAGLPIGPIANPGKESIAAVLDPEVHDFVFFVADGTGGHIFARTLAEHEANRQRWYEIRRQRGEM